MSALKKLDIGRQTPPKGSKKRSDYKPHPQAAIDYDALYDEVTRLYPKIMKRLAE